MAKEPKAKRTAIERIRSYWRGMVVKHLCDRGLASQQAWTAMFLKLVDHVAVVRAEIERVGDSPEEVGFDPREPLVWAWCVLDSMPNDQEQRYQALRERAADGSGIEDRADALRQRGYVMAGLKTARDLQVPWLAALARALDDDLAALQYWPEDVTQWKPEEWCPPGYACFVVPVRRGYRLADGRPAQRRALRHHAVIPQRVGSLGVALHLHPDASLDDLGADPERWTFGSAAFPDMTVVPAGTGDGGFLLVDAPLVTDEAALIGGQIDQAREAASDVLVWPELTMPSERLALLKARLAASTLDGRRIPLVVAGSWHVKDEADGHVNRSEVMLGDGEPILSYDKRRRFPWQGMMESINTGRTLPVIVMEDRLIGVAICRDNCDDNARETYRELPMDLVIVPSMGAESTVEAQERHAKAQRSRQGTVSLIVQQNPAVEGEPRPAGPPAFSFVRPDEGGQPGLGQDVPFRALR